MYFYFTTLKFLANDPAPNNVYEYVYVDLCSNPKKIP